MGDFFTLNTRFAFGEGCDLSSYVRSKMPCRQHRADDLPTRLAAMQQWRKDNATRLEQLQLLAAG